MMPSVSLSVQFDFQGIKLTAFYKVVIAVDYQEGLFNLVRDVLLQKLKSNLYHASLAKLSTYPSF
jgi:hypothetical protein